MIAFIDDHRGAHGVEPICKVLPIAPSTYHAHVAKRRNPAKRSARARQDAALKVEVRRVFEENFSVYGVRKVWRQLKREGFDVARCTVSRLMRDMGLQGVLCHEHRRSTRAMRNCTRDEGGPFGFGNQVPISSHRKLLRSKAVVVNVAENVGTRSRQARSREASASEPLQKCRKRIR